jgi:hypothetical protein
MTPKARKKFSELPQDFMTMYGYSSVLTESPNTITHHAEKFKNRVLTIGNNLYKDTPVMKEANFLFHNIVLFKQAYYAIPQNLGPLNITELSPIELKKIPNDTDYSRLKEFILKKRR